MSPEDGIKMVRAELEAGIGLPKCQRCGCMESALRNLAAVLPTIGQMTPPPLYKASLNRSITCVRFNTPVWGATIVILPSRKCVWFGLSRS